MNRSVNQYRTNNIASTGTLEASNFKSGTAIPSCSSTRASDHCCSREGSPMHTSCWFTIPTSTAGTTVQSGGIAMTWGSSWPAWGAPGPTWGVLGAPGGGVLVGTVPGAVHSTLVNIDLDNFGFFSGVRTSRLVLLNTDCLFVHCRQEC